MKLLPTTKAALPTMFAICFALIGNAATAQIDTTRYITKTIVYTDTAAVKLHIAEAKHTIELRKQELQQLKDEHQRNKADFEYIHNNMGKKVQTESQQALLNRALENYESYVKNKIEKSSDKEEQFQLRKQLSKEQKNTGKGTITMAQTSFVNKLIETNDELISTHERTLQRHEDNVIKFEKKFYNNPIEFYKDIPHNFRLYGLDESFSTIDYCKIYNDWQDTTDVIIGSKDRLANYVAVDGQQIPNQNSWLWLYHHKNSEWEDRLTALLNQGWEWAISNDLQHVNQSYPTKISFDISDEHPEYAIINNAIYTKEGALVRIINCQDALISSSNNSPEKAIINYIYRKDYESNKYDIKEKGEKTQKYIMRELGYASAQKSESEKAQEQRESDQTLQSLMRLEEDSRRAKANQRYARNSTEYQKAKQAEMRAGAQALQLLLNIKSDKDDDAVAYLQQLKTDHEKSLGHVYYYERYDDTSFIVKYTGQEHWYTVKITYAQDKPFSNQYTTTDISEDEPINEDDFKRH